MSMQLSKKTSLVSGSSKPSLMKKKASTNSSNTMKTGEMPAKMLSITHRSIRRSSFLLVILIFPFLLSAASWLYAQDGQDISLSAAFSPI